MVEKVLIVEDDADIVEILSLYLSGAGFEVETAPNGAVGIEQLKASNVSVVLADIMMPVMNGYEFIKAAREFSNVPIILVSARHNAADKTLGLDLGADGYVTKPFDPMEVLAYVRAALRRYRQSGEASDKAAQNGSQDKQNNKLCVGDLELDLNQLVLRKQGKIVPLTASELKIMMQLMQSPGRIYTKAQLYEAISGEIYIGGEDTVMVHVSNIRAKLGENPDDSRGADGSPSAGIVTVRGLGYRIEAQ